MKFFFIAKYSLYSIYTYILSKFEHAVVVSVVIVSGSYVIVVGFPESNGYIYVEANGVLNQQRTSV